MVQTIVLNVKSVPNMTAFGVKVSGAEMTGHGTKPMALKICSLPIQPALKKHCKQKFGKNLEHNETEKKLIYFLKKSKFTN